jgi:molecular chaperone GrpE
MSASEANPVPNGDQNESQTLDPAETMVDTGALQAALVAAEAKALESRDLYMRALAEMENMRKRSVRDLEQAHKFALEKFANDLISVKDSLEMGLAAAGTADVQSLLAGTDARPSRRPV